MVVDLISVCNISILWKESSEIRKNISENVFVLYYWRKYTLSGAIILNRETLIWSVYMSSLYIYILPFMRDVFLFLTTTRHVLGGIKLFSRKKSMVSYWIFRNISIPVVHTKSWGGSNELGGSITQFSFDPHLYV